MTTEYDTDALTEAFSAYIEKIKEHPPSTEAETTRSIDLYRLFVELSELKAEVKGESRLIKSTVDEFSQVFETLRSSQQQLQSDLKQARKASEAQRQRLLKPMLLQWLEIRDQVTASIENLEKLRPGGMMAVFRRGYCRLLDSLLQGQTMTLTKLDERLASHDVIKIKTMGERLDPHNMQAVATTKALDLENGIVTNELRSGFLWQGELLRYAEVTVNKQ